MCGRWANLLYFLLLWDLISESGRCSESRYLWLALRWQAYSIESAYGHIHGVVWTRIGFNRIPLELNLTLLLMFPYPKFPVHFVLPRLDDLIMRIVISRSRTHIGQKLNVLMEKSLLFLQFLSFLLFFQLFLLLFYRLFQTVGANSGNFSFLLVKLDLLQVGMFGQFRVNFSEFCYFVQTLHVPRLVVSVINGWRDTLGNLEVIIHVETTFSNVVFVLLPFFLLGILPLQNLVKRV